MLNSLTRITIIGAGLCGLMMALYLAKRGYFVELYEKANELNVNAISKKRSTALDLSERAILALSELGLIDQVLARSVPTTDRVLFCGEESLTIEHGFEPSHIIYNVARSHLYNVLFSAVKKNSHIQINFSHELVCVDIEKRLLFFKLNYHHTMVAKNYFQVLGCDGINSVLRQVLNNKYAYNKNYSYSYKAATLPAAFIKENLIPNRMYKWISHQVSLLAHAKSHMHFDMVLLLPIALENHVSSVFTKTNFPQLQNVIDYLYQAFRQQDFNRIKSTKVSCQQKENILLLGDAAHGMLPFLGQGINCAFEDCRLLNDYLIRYEDNWEKATKTYVEYRSIDTNAIIEMSETEYQEFAPGYDFKKQKILEGIKIELNKRHPHFFKSHRYLLAFTQLSYEKIREHYQLQLQILNRIYHCFKSIENIQWQTVDKWIHTTFNEYTIAYCCHY